MPPVVVGAVALGGAAIAAGGVGLALAAGGVMGAVASFGASMLLSGVASAIAGKPKAPLGIEGRNVTVREPASPRQLVYGETRKGGTIVYMAASGTQPSGGNPLQNIDGSSPGGFGEALKNLFQSRGTNLLHLVVVLAGHPCHAIEEIYFEGELAFDAWGNPQGRYAGKAAVLKHYGYAGEVAFPALNQWLPEWTAQHRLTGCAAIAVRLVFDNETYPNGIPNITVKLKGRPDIYDPRTGTRGYSNNAALCAASYLEDKTYGLGAQIGATVGVRTDHLIEAANICDEIVATPEAGRTERRYTCNGVVDVSATPQSIIEGMLSAMAGRAVFKGGRWSIHAGAYRVPVLDLGLGDLAGPLQVTTRMSRSSIFNGVRGKFISPDNDWQPDDFPAYKSAVYVAEDNGAEIWTDINLPFTTSPYAAQRIAKIELELARRQISLSLTTNMKGLRASAGENITFTHERYGWAAKPFVVTAMSLQPSTDGQGFTPVLSLTETSPLVYDWNASEAQIYAAAPRAMLPPVWFIAQPGITEVREELYVTRTGDGAAARALISWSASDEARIDRYVLQFSRDGQSWLPVTETSDTTATHEGWAAGPMHYRVQAIGQLGQRSEWSYWSGELYGLAAPPVALENVSIQTAGGLAVIKWALPTDLDVRYGGRIMIRHAAASGAAWSNTVSLDEVQGNTTIAVVPLMPGVYFVRPIDASGQMGPAATLFADGAQAIGFVDAGLLQADDEFSGTHDGTIETGGILTLTDVGIFDDVPDTDALASWDYPYGVSTRGVYTFATTLAWGTPRLVRMRSVIEMAPLVLSDDWDQRTGTVDSWLSWDAMADVECDVEMQVRTTTDDPSGSPVWSPWSRLDAGEYRARGVQARAILTSRSPDVAPILSVLRVKAEQVAA